MVVVLAGMTPGARTFAGFGLPGDAPYPTLAEGRGDADGTATLRFIAPSDPRLVQPDPGSGRSPFPCTLVHAGDEGGGVTLWVPYVP